MIAMRPAVSMCCCAAVLMACLVNLPSSAATEAMNSSEIINILSRQVMLQQLFVEERIRSEGGSGVKQMRVHQTGPRPYNNANHAARSAAAAHDHANYIRTVGMGEIIAILNGLEFRTRHNDYRLVMPSTKNNKYHETEDIPFPKVPSRVTKKENVTEAVDEMKEWFRAWLNQDDSKRDYKKYFKPILCYLEGHWTTVSDTLEDPFGSDRHQLDARSPMDLQEKVRFTSATGAKSNLENFAYLPTTIMNVTNGIPVLAQWTYRILCHPLKRDVPLSRFKTVDDLGARLNSRSTMKEHAKKRAARFQLDPRMDMSEDPKTKQYRGFLDLLMEEIPGVDNYGGNLNDTAFGMASYQARDEPDDPLKILNTAFYHSVYETSKKGALGKSIKRRGYSDDHIFMAQTSNPRVPEVCTFFEGRDELLEKKVKRTECQRWTYAIPLEIIYLTPLSEWNPYNLAYKGDLFGAMKTDEADWVRMDGRNGAQDIKRAYNGTNSRCYFQTPSELFRGRGLAETMSADTSNKNVGVLDPNGDMKVVGPTGIRIMFEIAEVGTVRQRWPMFEVPGQSGAAWKELEALKDVVLGNASGKFNFAYYNETA